MSIDTNTVIITGRLTRDPEDGFTKNNKNYCNFSIAANDGKYNDLEVVYFFDINTWGKLAEICQKHLDKGSQVIVTGKLKQNRFQDKQGQKRSMVSILASSIQFVGGKKEGSNQAPPSAPSGSSQEKKSENPFDKIDFQDPGNEEIPF